MSSNVVNQVSYLRTSRNFPPDLQQLTVEVNKAYVDIANAVNNRTISIFPTINPALNGESWFISNNQRQQGFRKVFAITGSGNIAHGIDTTTLSYFTKIYGTFTDGTKWYPLPYVNTLNVTNQISLDVTSTNIEITAGGGAPPTITKGLVILEWISNP